MFCAGHILTVNDLPEEVRALANMLNIKIQCNDNGWFAYTDSGLIYRLICCSHSPRHEWEHELKTVWSASRYSSRELK